ncbi:cell division protein CrgA [Nonomuraea sp. NPDC050680]|uniref:cell division protein CrgA n=1 Tax=Nonomuraea sp. NPDC050680 TaxID=3154630 RepID=UPI00340A8F69
MSEPYPREGTPTPPRQSTRSVRRWAVAMSAAWIVGVLLIVMYYVDPTLPVLGEFGNWNLLVGFGLLLLGAVFGVFLLVALVLSARRRP